MASMSISACIIARNESAVIGKCLASLRPFVDEMLVGDTGSTDGTADVARLSGAAMFPVPWEDDFSRARNMVLDQARGDWILSIDADEVLDACDAGALRACMGNPAIRSAWGLMRPMHGWTSCRVLRLFRNDPAVRFEGIIHESVLDTLRKRFPEDSFTDADCGIRFIHSGYDRDPETKHNRNLPLLIREIARVPGRTNNLCHHARILFDQGNSAAGENVLLNAIEIVRRENHPQAVHALPFVDLVLHRRERNEASPALAEEAFRRFPDNPFTIWIHAGELMAAKRYGEAVPLFTRLAGWGESGEYPREIPYPERIFSTWTFNSLGICHSRLGDGRESRRWFDRAIAGEPDNPAYQCRRSLSAFTVL